MFTWQWYWGMTEGNVIATPLCMIFEGLILSGLGYVFRKPIGRFIGWLRREEHQAASDAHRAARLAREDAAKARAITADLYRRLLGEDHPHAPAPGE